eukprot:1716355-Amphidinium_carterae.1
MEQSHSEACTHCVAIRAFQPINFISTLMGTDEVVSLRARRCWNQCRVSLCCDRSSVIIVVALLGVEELPLWILAQAAEQLKGLYELKLTHEEDRCAMLEKDKVKLEECTASCPHTHTHRGSIVCFHHISADAASLQ